MSTSHVSMIMYDFPMETKSDIRAYTKFRKQLLKTGYYKMQESIYIKRVNTTDRIQTIEKTIQALAPDTANIRILNLTLSQFKKMRIISGEKNLSERIIRQETPILEF